MFKKITLILLCILHPLSANNQSKYQTPTHAKEIAKKLDAYLQALTKLNRFSGSVVIAQGKSILLDKGYGYAHREFDVLNVSQTKFRICSINKMLTATALMQLQEKGLLRVNDTINTYLPDYPRGDEITLHHLLMHRSGLPSENYPLEMIVWPSTLKQRISFFKDKPLQFNPGSDFQYSNAGYSLLSSIIEKVSGKNYASYITENILSPLNITNNFFAQHDYEILKNCASGYCFNQSNILVNGHYVYNDDLWCTAHDLYTFARGFNSGLLLNQKSLQEIIIACNNEENYGYGCERKNMYDRVCIGHGGMISSGYKTNLSIFRDEDIYIILLSNNFCSWINEARDALAAIIFGASYDMPTSDTIKVDPEMYNDYKGIYNHPYVELYTIEKKDNKLYIPKNIELIPVGKDQFIAANYQADNILYTFMRDETGYVIQLRIKGGGPYFELRCDKNMKDFVSL